MKPDRNLQYKYLAKYYDLVHKSKDYAREATVLRKMIAEFKVSPGMRILDVGCGTGKHLKYLTSDFDCTGLDLHKDMLRIAKKNAPEAKFVSANMSDFHLKNKFDVILCMFSTIGLVRTYTNLEHTIKNFLEHLNYGGLIIVENDSFSSSKSAKNSMNLLTAEARDIKIARVGYYQKEDFMLIEREDYLVLEKGKGIRHYVDLQHVGMFDLKRTVRIMEDVGLKTKFLKGKFHSGTGILLGIKQS